MRRLAGVLALALALAVTAGASGHFVFILPGEGRVVRVVFSDSLKPDGELAKKVAHTRFAVRTADGKVAEVKAKVGKQTLDVEVPGSGPALVTGVTSYGVVAKGKVPFLLTYYSRSAVGVDGRPPAFLGRPEPRLVLDVVPVAGGKPRAQVLYKGKPAAGAEVALYVPGKDEPVTTKADKEGMVALEAPEKDGTYAVRAAHRVSGKGQHAGKEYGEARSYATLTFPVRSRR